MASAKKNEQKGLVPSQIQETAKPSKRLTLQDLMRMQGASGTYIVNGFLEGDYNPDLSGINGVNTFDQMRRSDAQVRATLDAMELPIRSTDWYVEAGTNEEGETDELCDEIRDFAEEALFRKMEQTWDDHLREVLTFLPFGFCVKEKVYVSDGERIWIQKLAFRKPQTIYKWEQLDGTAGVTQILPTPVQGEDGKRVSQVSIPATKLLLFTFRKEGDNYAGVSVLRPAYRHWYTKDLLYKFDAIKHERQSVGVPFLKLPSKAGEEDKAVARQILQDLRANEQTGIVIPDGWEFGFADLQASNTSDVWRSIDHHNLMIAKNVLAMFMEIVGGDNGSRALSEDQSDFFLLAQEAVAKQIDDVHNRFLLPELVDLNFDVPASSYYPKLAHKKLGSVDYQTISSVLSTLVTAGLLTPQAQDEDWTRKMLDLPKLVVPEEGEEEAVEIDPETGLPIEPEVDPETGLPLDGAPVETDEEGNPIEPELDEEGNPIESEDEEEVGDDELASLEDELADVDADQDELDTPDDDDEGEPDGGEEIVPEDGDEPLDEGEVVDEEEDPDEKKPRFFEVKGKRYAFYEGEFYAPATELAGFDGEKFTEEVHSFRIVSEETKRKISESLKRALPNKPVVQPRYRRGQPIPEDIRRKISEGLKKALPGDTEKTKAEAAARGKVRKMRSLTQRRLGTSKNKGTAAVRKAQTAQIKPKGGVIAKTAAARLAKAGKKPKKSTTTDAKKQAVPKVTKTNTRRKRKPRVSRKKVNALKQELASAKTPKARAVVKAKVQKLRKKAKAAPKTAAGKSVQQNVAKRKAARMRTGKARGIKATEDLDAPEAAKNADTALLHEHDGEEQAVYEQYVSFCDWEQIVRLQNSVPRTPEDTEPKARQWQFNDVEATAFRPLTFAEKKVNFSSLRKALSSAKAKFEGDIDGITERQKKDILAQVKRAVESDDIAKVGEIKAKYTGELAGALTGIQMDMFEAGKKSVAGEMGVKVPPTAREVAGALRVQNDSIVDKFVTDMEAAASSAVSQTVAKRGGSIASTGTTEAVAAAADAIDKAVRQGKGAMQTLSVIGTLNLGRATIFERYPEEVAAMQYSAIIDDSTTDICLSLDGLVVKPGSAEFYQYSPPRHYGCRSIWVEILRDEGFVPGFTGIPKSIPANATIDTFEDLKAPVLRDKSAAIRVIQEELDDRKAKVKEYEESGQYQNRIATHQARIDALEQSLEGVTPPADGK